MNKRQTTAQDTRERILMTAMNMIREKGFTATRIDDICERAGITKGAFFHHFKSKEDMALKAAEFFAVGADRLFTAAPFRTIKDPVDRLLGYIDFREAILTGEVPEYTCLLGTIVQEVHVTYPAIRDACYQHIHDHAATLIPMIEEAIAAHGVKGIDAEELALYTQAVLQGAFILAKGSQSEDIAKASVRHLKRYVEQIFKPKGN